MTDSTKARPSTGEKPRQIVGFSLTPAMAREVKAHAGKQGLSLRKLFEDMWQVYKRHGSGGKP